MTIKTNSSPSLPTPGMVILLTVLHLTSPFTLLAADNQRGVQVTRSGPAAVVAGLHGAVHVQPADGSPARPVQFHDVLQPGEVLSTQAEGMVEILIESASVVTLTPNSTLHLITEPSGDSAVYLHQGQLRVAASPRALTAQQAHLVIRTPGSKAITAGGVATLTVRENDLQARQSVIVPIAFPPKQQRMNGPTTVDSYAVQEGAFGITPPSNNVAPVSVGAGQGLTINNGTLGSPNGQPLINPLVNGSAWVAATHSHEHLPEASQKVLTQNQMQLAQELSQAMVGAATTETGGEGEANSENVVLAVTGNTFGPGSGASSGGANNPILAQLFGDGSGRAGGAFGHNNTSGSGQVDDINDDGTFNIRSFSVDDFPDQGGLLVFTDITPKIAQFDENFNFTEFTLAPTERSKFNSNFELFVVDGGNPAAAPHGGKVPTSTLVGRGLNQNQFDDPARNAIDNSNNIDPSQLNDERGLLFQDKLDELSPTRLQTFVVKSKSDSNREVFNKTLDRSFPILADAILGDFSTEKDSKILETGNSDPFFVSDTPFPSEDANGNRVLDPGEDLNKNGELDHVYTFLRFAATARSQDKDSPVTLTGGVTLDQNTELTMGDTPLADAFFSGGETYGTVAGIIANGNDSAYAKIEDRVLAVLNGSTIKQQAGKMVSLLSILDGQLKGPDQPSPFRQNDTGQNIVPPLIDVKARETMPDFATTPPDISVTSAVKVVSKTITDSAFSDPALLQASAPLATFINTVVETASHFAHFEREGTTSTEKLLYADLTKNGTVPLDALATLEGAQLTVANGNFLNVVNAVAEVTGLLFSATGGSTLAINNGVLVSLTNNATFNLTSNAFGAFGGAGDTLSIHNGLCGGANGCQTVPGFPDLLVAGGGNVGPLPSGFTPFVRPDGSGDPTLDIGADDAIFYVDGTSTFNVSAP